MAIRTGTGGFIQFADTSGASIAGTPAARKMTLSKWTLNIPISEGDTTGFQATNNLRTAIAGKGGLSGTFEGYLDDTNLFVSTDLTDAEAAAANIVLQSSRTAPTGALVAQQGTISGWLTKFAVGCKPGEPNSVAGAFVGTGAPAWAKANLA